VIVIRREPMDGPAATALIEQVQQEYVRRYGTPDGTPIQPEDFAPPRGAFFVAYLDDAAVGCGGVRCVDARVAEIKRMYVDPSRRKQGVARTLLRALERAAADLGAQSLRLETGSEQPEAVSLYDSAGYSRIPGYGLYADDPRNICMAKPVC
jgi:GNAT superfamily N-acetyltransferase